MYHAINAPKIDEARAHHLILSACTDNQKRNTAAPEGYQVHFDQFGTSGDYLARLYAPGTLDLLAVAMVSPSDQLVPAVEAEVEPETKGDSE